MFIFFPQMVMLNSVYASTILLIQFHPSVPPGNHPLPHRVNTTRLSSSTHARARILKASFVTPSLLVKCNIRSQPHLLALDLTQQKAYFLNQNQVYFSVSLEKVFFHRDRIDSGRCCHSLNFHPPIKISRYAFENN